ncbi:MAG: hypothetical protein DME26_12535 [Verrucomicrobia bacterium]|nr:MAG: hypothetical protein DME26_12535 [Verrucomicrobiota bacterium]
MEMPAFGIAAPVRAMSLRLCVTGHCCQECPSFPDFSTCKPFFALGLRRAALYIGAQFALAGSARTILGTGL